MSVLSARGAACLALLLACRTPGGPPAAVPPAPDAATLAASSAPVSPFAPCTATPTAKGQTFDCGEVEAWTVQLGQMEPQAAMDMSLRALRGVVQGSGPERVSKVTLAGKEWPAAQVSACAEDARTCQVGQVVTVTGPDGAARLIGCASRGTGSTLSDRCQGMLEWLAKDAVPTGDLAALAASASASGPVLLGRTLQVPSGCAVVPTNSSGGRVLCEDGTDFAWAEAATLSEKELTSRRDSTTAMMAAASGAVEHGKTVPCVVEGTPTQCRRLDERRGKVAVRHYVGAANVANGRALVVTCGSLAAQQKTLAQVCNGVLALP